MNINSEEEFLKIAEVSTGAFITDNKIFVINLSDGFYPAKNSIGYFPRLYFMEEEFEKVITRDMKIAKEIDLTWQEYLIKMKEYNAVILGQDNEYYFTNFDDCNKFIDEVIHPKYLFKKLSS